MREKHNSITKKGRNVIGANQSFFSVSIEVENKRKERDKKENIDIFNFFDKCFDYFVRCLRFLMVAFKLTFVSVLGQSFSIKCLWAPNFIAIEYHAFENLQGNKIEQQYFFFKFSSVLERDVFVVVCPFFKRLDEN